MAKLLEREATRNGFARALGTTEGTLGIELNAFTVALQPIQVMQLAEAQMQTGSDSPSSARQARLLAIDAEKPGSVCVVLTPTPVVSLGRVAEDGNITVMEAKLVLFQPKRAKAKKLFISPKDFFLGERVGYQLMKNTLETRLLDKNGNMMPEADVLGAFRAGVIVLEAWMSINNILTKDELAVAEKNQNPTIRVWSCLKPE